VEDRFEETEETLEQEEYSSRTKETTSLPIGTNHPSIQTYHLSYFDDSPLQFKLDIGRERVEWVNLLVSKIWPHLGPFVNQIVEEKIRGIVSKIKVPLLV
jgi:hypothetical protein